jgi:hypothetical protein
VVSIGWSVSSEIEFGLDALLIAAAVHLRMTVALISSMRREAVSNRSPCDLIEDGYTLLALAFESCRMVLSVPKNRCVSYTTRTPALNLLTQPVPTIPNPTRLYSPSSFVGATTSM